MTREWMEWSHPGKGVPWRVNTEEFDALLDSGWKIILIHDAFTLLMREIEAEAGDTRDSRVIRYAKAMAQNIRAKYPDREGARRRQHRSLTHYYGKALAEAALEGR